jgi:hypothetical protein
MALVNPGMPELRSLTGPKEGKIKNGAAPTRWLVNPATGFSARYLSISLVGVEPNISGPAELRALLRNNPRPSLGFP